MREARECLIRLHLRGILEGMNGLSAGAVFFICLFLGIIFDNVAIGIIAGFLLGAGAGRVTAAKGAAIPKGPDGA